MTAAGVRVLPAGDRALVVEFGDAIDPALAALVTRLAARLAARPPAGLVETVPTYRSLMVHLDPVACDPEAFEADVRRAAMGVLAEGGGAGARPEGRLVEVPVRYGGEAGPDLGYVAEKTGLSPDEVVRLHAAGTYLVYMIGFLPGFPYLGGLDPRLTTPRLPTPRLKIPAGSVGIGGQQTGIYSMESPGGWALIGRTDLVLFDPARAEPCLLAAGDRVRFVPVSEPPSERPALPGASPGVRGPCEERRRAESRAPSPGAGPRG